MRPYRKKGFLTLFASLLFCVAIGRIFWSTPPKEPTYQGRTLSTWLYAAAYHNEAWWPGQEATDAAVRAMGTNAVPFLLLQINRGPDPRSRLKERLSMWLLKLNQPKQAIRFYDPYGQQRLNAARGAMTALRPRAKEVVPMLMGIYAQTNRYSAAYRSTAMAALGYLGPAARDALPFVLRETANTNDALRQGAFWTLRELHPDAASALPVFMRGLQDPCPCVGEWAAYGIGDLGRVEPEVLSALQQFSERMKASIERTPDPINYRVAQGAAEFALGRLNK